MLSVGHGCLLRLSGLPRLQQDEIKSLAQIRDIPEKDLKSLVRRRAKDNKCLEDYVNQVRACSKYDTKSCPPPPRPCAPDTAGVLCACVADARPHRRAPTVDPGNDELHTVVPDHVPAT